MKNRIREMRKQMGLNQSQLAEKVGATLRQVSYWESGKGLSLEDACKIADVFNCTLDELAGRDFRSRSYPDPRQEALNGYYECMNDTGKKLAVDSVKAMSSSVELRMGKNVERAGHQAKMGA